MKKTLIICLVALICLSSFTPALAAENGIITLTSGMPKVAGTTNQYNPYAIASAGLPEQVSVGFTLYKIVGGQEIYVTSDSDSGYGSYFEAEDYVTLSSGTYKLYAYYQGETKSDGSVKTYII